MRLSIDFQKVGDAGLMKPFFSLSSLSLYWHIFEVIPNIWIITSISIYKKICGFSICSTRFLIQLQYQRHALSLSLSLMCLLSYSFIKSFQIWKYPNFSTCSVLYLVQLHCFNLMLFCGDDMHLMAANSKLPANWV